MTHGEIAEQLYDELQHNHIADLEEYCKRRTELTRAAWPNDSLIDHEPEVELYIHEKYCFGFCDMCGDTIFYDEDTWYDLCQVEPEEAEILEETLPVWEKRVDGDIQTVCSSCFHKLLKKEDD